MEENEFGPGWLIAALLGIKWFFRPRRPRRAAAPLLAVDTSGLDRLESDLERQLRAHRP